MTQSPDTERKSQVVDMIAQLENQVEQLSAENEQLRALLEQAPALTTELEQQRRWHEELLDRLPSPVLLIEPGTARVTFANKAADAMAGGEFPKEKPADEYHAVYYCTDESGQRIPDEQMPGVRAARGEVLQDFQMNWHTPAGVRSLLLESATIAATHGRPETIIVNFQDVSVLKRTAAALRASDEELRQANQELQAVNKELSAQAEMLQSQQEELQSLNVQLRRHTEHVEAQVVARAAELVDSERRFRAVFDQSFGIIGILAPDGTLLDANQTAFDVMGCRREDVIGLPFWKTPWWSRDPAVQAVIEDCVARAARGEVTNEELTYLAQDESQRVLDFSLAPVTDVDGRIVYLVPQGRDVTERKEQEALQARRSRHALLRAEVGNALSAKGSQRAMLQACAEAVVRHLDAAFTRIWTLDEVAQMLELQASAGLYTHLDGADARVPVGDLEIGRVSSGLKPHLTNDALHDERLGNPAWARREGMMAFAGYSLVVEGRLVGVIQMTARQVLQEDTLEAFAMIADLVAQGIDRKRTELRLDEERDFLRALLESLQEGIVACDAQGKLTLFNRATREFHGLPQKDVPAPEWASYYDLYMADGKTPMALADVPLFRALGGEAVHDVDMVIAPKSGPARYLLASGQAIYSREGKQLGAVIAMHDVTERKRAEEAIGQHNEELQAVNEELMAQSDELAQQQTALQTANARLREVDQHKDEFLSVISHELRTPLNFIMGFASILEDEVPGPLNPQQLDAVGRILSGADRMIVLVDDLLDFARMQAGQFELTLEPTDYGQIITETIASLRPLAAQKSLTLAIEGMVTHAVTMDARRVLQILTNLIANAIKFTNTGGVRVQVFEHGQTLVTEVTDTGCGIAEEDLPKLFTRFQQLDMSKTRVAGGTGLGLAIVKALVEAHGGVIEVESAPERGSTFRFVLPLFAAPPQTP
jgi:PAS domain S-box-containing protein